MNGRPLLELIMDYLSGYNAIQSYQYSHSLSMIYKQPLSDLLDVCIIIYLDDILIYSNNISEHYHYVKKVLKCLCKAGLYAEVEKCKFYSSKLVKYLKYILSSSDLLKVH